MSDEQTPDPKTTIVGRWIFWLIGQDAEKKPVFKEIFVSEEDWQIKDDIADERARIGSRLTQINELHADSVDKLMRCEADYKHWRAKLIMKWIDDKSPLTSAEWKINVGVEAEAEYPDRKHQIASFEADVAFLAAQIKIGLEVSRQLCEASASIRSRYEVEAGSYDIPTNDKAAAREVIRGRKKD